MTQRTSPVLYSPERTAFFSDGVFAIALTLLVIELRVPEAESGFLLAALAGLWPKILCFGISFLLISVVWFNHHALFHHLGKVDHGLILLNILLLFDIVGLPFVSALLGEYVASPEGADAVTAAVIYGAWVTWGGVAFNLVWYRAATAPGLQAGHSKPQARKNLSWHFARGPVLYALATGSAFLNVWVSLGLFFLLIVIFFIPARAS